MKQIKVNKVVFIKHHAWYLSIVLSPAGIPDCYWSHHDRTGMTDAQAKTAFEREHFKEVSEQVRLNIKQMQERKLDHLIINN